MKSYIVGLFLLAITSIGFSNEIFTKPYNPNSTQNVITENVSGVWYAFNPFGLEVTLLSGQYFEDLGGFSTCGKYVDVSVALPRTFPVNGTFFGRGAAYDSTGTGVTTGTVINLLPPGKSGVYGTLKVDSFTNTNLVVTITTPAGGPNGTFTLVRVPIIRDNIATLTPIGCK
ncbi:MAG: hypothetical protein ACK4PR_01300 [Gammaproteobacteria bacterium]